MKMEDHEFGMNQAENQTIDCLIEGHHYSHTGVYDIFSYDLEEEGEQTFPIQIQVNERIEHTTKIYIQTTSLLHRKRCSLVLGGYF